MLIRKERCASSGIAALPDVEGVTQLEAKPSRVSQVPVTSRAARYCGNGVEFDVLRMAVNFRGSNGRSSRCRGNQSGDCWMQVEIQDAFEVRRPLIICSGARATITETPHHQTNEASQPCSLLSCTSTSSSNFRQYVKSTAGHS